jgi:hypothetical protein
MKCRTWVLLCVSIQFVVWVALTAVAVRAIQLGLLSIYTSSLEDDPAMQGLCLQVTQDGYRPVIECFFFKVGMVTNRVDMDFKFRLMT